MQHLLTGDPLPIKPDSGADDRSLVVRVTETTAHTNSMSFPNANRMVRNQPVGEAKGSCLALKSRPGASRARRMGA